MDKFKVPLTATDKVDRKDPKEPETPFQKLIFFLGIFFVIECNFFEHEDYSLHLMYGAVSQRN